MKINETTLTELAAAQGEARFCTPRPGEPVKIFFANLVPELDLIQGITLVIFTPTSLILGR